MNDMTTIQLIALDLRNKCEGKPDLESRCKAAFTAVADGHWMVAAPGSAGQDICFRGAVGAVLLDPATTAEEQEHIHESLRQLRALSGLMTGMPMNMEEMVKRAEEHPPLPLMKWWHEVRDAVKAGKG